MNSLHRIREDDFLPSLSTIPQQLRTPCSKDEKKASDQTYLPKIHTQHQQYNTHVYIQVHQPPSMDQLTHIPTTPIQILSTWLPTPAVALPLETPLCHKGLKETKKATMLGLQAQHPSSFVFRSDCIRILPSHMTLPYSPSETLRFLSSIFPSLSHHQSLMRRGL